MQQRLSVILLTILLGACVTTMSQADDLKPFPPAGPAVLRNVIRLPVADDESRLRVELVIGKETEIDCNQHWFGGKLDHEVIVGWGYPLYRLSNVSGPASTMMACPPDVEKRTAFVTVRLEDPFVRYNSKLPIVIYVPEGFSVRYRVWSAPDEYSQAIVE
ncbi:MAG: serine protease inhibitor ecotin [Planctomycetaceae bacterium]|nr:serine protease inhibitor ecotin [Planctomycetaceae bacterium]